MVSNPETDSTGPGFVKVDKESRVYRAWFAVKGPVRKGQTLQCGERVRWPISGEGSWGGVGWGTKVPWGPKPGN